jgi:hypothetical protein
MTVPSATSRTNEAAERLRRLVAEHPMYEGDVDEALSQEGRRIVAEIRDRTGKLPEYEGDIVPVLEGMTRLLQALDEVAR